MMIDGISIILWYITIAETLNPSQCSKLRFGCWHCSEAWPGERLQRQRTADLQVIGEVSLAPESFTLWWTNIAMENHHFLRENPLFLWPFSIAFCMFTRGYALLVDICWPLPEAMVFIQDIYFLAGPRGPKDWHSGAEESHEAAGDQWQIGLGFYCVLTSWLRILRLVLLRWFSYGNWYNLYNLI